MYFKFKWDHSSAGRAPALQAGGHRFEPYWSHHFGGVPEWPKGADCKSVSYAFSGSNPLSSTIQIYNLFLFCGCSSVVEPRPSKPVARVRSPSPAPFFLLASIAQLDRAVAFEAMCQGFESLQVHHTYVSFLQSLVFIENTRFLFLIYIIWYKKVQFCKLLANFFIKCIGDDFE